LSAFEGASLNIISSLWEQVAKGQQDFFGDAHENDVWHWLIGFVLFVLWTIEESLEHDVGLQIVKDLVVTKVAKLRQVKDGLLLVQLVVLVVVHFDETLADEVHFLHITLVADNTLSRRRNTTVHLNDKLVGEAALALLEEVIEGSLEFFEDSGVLNQISLHLGCDLLVELELLDDQVEIVEEGLLDVLSDIVIQRWLNMERLVGLLNLLDPHVK